MRYLSEQTADQGGGSYMADQSTQTNTGGGDQIPLSRADYDKLQRQAARAEELESRVKESEQDWGHVRNLLRPGGDPSKVEESIRKVMLKEGYSPEEVEEYIEEQRQEEEGGGYEADEYDDDDEDMDDAERFIVNTREEIQQLKAQSQQTERTRLEGLLNENVIMSLDRRSELGKLVEALAPSLAEEGGETDKVQELRRTLLGDVKRETLERLRVRRIREGGRWNDSWIQEEAANAAKTVHGKYRLIVPNPSKLGRSSDYSAEQDYVTNTKPVKAPEYKRGMSPADVSRESRGWAVDQLLRASVDAERDSKSDSPI